MKRAELMHHLHAELLPLWLEHGRDRQGGFHSRLDERLRPAPGDARRLRAQTRMTYVLARAALDGAGDWALAAAREAFAFLHERFRDARHGGWYTTIEPGGAPLDRGKDTYDHAFALLALAELARATGESAPLDAARAALDLLDAKLADRAGGGYLEGAAEDWTPRRDGRRQNPHMHLFEALLALHEADAGGGHLERAAALVALLRERFVDPETGALREHFGADWRPAPPPRGDVVEPGHHFEWSWLLAEYARLAGGDDAPADALFAFGCRHGLDARHGGVFDEIDRSGRVTRASKRLWPQLEYVHALARRGGDPQALEAQLRLCLDRYHAADTHGWREQADREGRITSAWMNATSVYHVYGALSAAAGALG